MFEQSIQVPINKKHEDHYLFASIKLALSCSTVNYETKMLYRDLLPQHYDLIVRDTFEISKDSNGFVTEFAPDVFQALRTARGIGQTTFLQSCCHMSLPYWQLKSKETRNIYLTHDKRFALLFTSQSKLKTFLSYLRDYMQYLFANPSTLLVKVVGLFKVKLPFHSKTFIIVMENVFFPDYGITRRFSVKGCHYRNSSKQCTEYSDSFQEYLLNDKGFLNRKFKIKEFRLPFLQQLQADLKFLYQHELFGYTLLIGTHPHSAQEITADRLQHASDKNPVRRNSTEYFRELRKTFVQPSLLSHNPLHIIEGKYYSFYFGLVGIFKRYTFKDRIVCHIKTVRFCGRNHSTLDPFAYYRRLLLSIENCCDE